ncbi:hypothetical protein AMJ44_10045 [candidate division WOR-1 bacterium DG_54_3]|uniref:Uncharacterized protein n=1 Tax=candidate division WOR-1 bacterium DG_54_3 TaxID=1703775 RepID=A0A0S7XSL7_UNCSA|nr:MAG: hypothetical protein AMJ44_10045 [candidate division WOR-1 bacterium DG_54_3]
MSDNNCSCASGISLKTILFGGPTGGLAGCSSCDCGKKKPPPPPPKKVECKKVEISPRPVLREWVVAEAKVDKPVMLPTIDLLYADEKTSEESVSHPLVNCKFIVAEQEVPVKMVPESTVFALEMPVKSEPRAGIEERAIFPYPIRLAPEEKTTFTTDGVFNIEFKCEKPPFSEEIVVGELTVTKPRKRWGGKGKKIGKKTTKTGKKIGTGKESTEAEKAASKGVCDGKVPKTKVKACNEECGPMSNLVEQNECIEMYAEGIK